MIRPEPFFGRLIPKWPRFAKWLGYLDKYLLFPFVLIWQARRFALVHIVDHSNAVYVFWLRSRKSVVTCNDLLAVRSALGEMPEHQTGLTGRWLQKWILAGLRRANRITCISDATRRDVLRLTGKSEKEVSTIYLGLEPILRRSWSAGSALPEAEGVDHGPVVPIPIFYTWAVIPGTRIVPGSWRSTPRFGNVWAVRRRT